MIIPLNEYPHMPYWGTLSEAIVQFNAAYEIGHHAVLVFDEAYKFVGILLQKDVLKGLEPKFAQHYEDGVPVFWDELLQTGSEKRLAQPVKAVMSEIKVTIDINDSILKASHIMLQEDSDLLPVMAGDKLVGVLRMDELFHELTRTVLNL